MFVRSNTLRAASIVSAMALTVAASAQTPFGNTIGFEPGGDADAFVPTNPAHPFIAPGHPGAFPGLPLDFDDSRGTWDGLLEEIPSNSPLFGNVLANTGSGLAVVYPGPNDSYQAGYKNGPFSRIGRSTPFPIAGNQWAISVDIFAMPAAPGGELWWTNAASNNDGSGYLTETGFAITPGLGTWNFTTTTGGNPSINLPTGVWYRLEVVYDRSQPNVQAYHNVYDATGTTLLYQHLIPSGSMFLNPASSSLGGPRYSWFTVWNNAAVDRLYIDNLRAGGPPNPGFTLSLQPTGSCYKINDTVEVRINVAGLPFAAAGGQYFINFDHTKLQFLSAVPGDPGLPGSGLNGDFPPFPAATNPANPFETEVYQCNGETILGFCTPVSGRLDYAVGTSGGGPGSGSIANNTMAVLRFKAIAPVCSATNLVQFRDTVSGPLIPPTRLTDEFGAAMYPNLVNMGAITIDSTVPVITCPPTAKVQCPTPPTPANTGTATAVDNCDASPAIAYSDLTVSIFGSPTGWASRNENTASGTPVAGPPTPPAGIGSFRAQTGAGTGPGLGGKNYLFTSLFDNFPLISLSELKYWTYVAATANPNLAPALNLYVDLDNNGTRDTTLVFEPTYVTGGAIPAGWQQWNALANVNAWWYTAAFGTMSSPAGEYKPLSFYIAQYPNAKIVNWAGAPGFNIVTGQASGGSWANFDGNIDYVEINGFNFDFEPGPFCAQTIFRTWTATDDCNNTSFCTQQIFVVDTTPPVFTNACPLPPINVNADAGTCVASFATVNPTVPTANDACSSTTITVARSDSQPLNAPYPTGATTITWTATDACGNFSTCSQVVTVAAFNELLLTVQLQPNIAPPGALTRCIRLELWSCPGPAVIVDVPITFNVVAGLPNALASSASVLVPCGNYSCITARDRRHTLRRTASFGDGDFLIAGTQYMATFTGDPATPGGDWLIGGNLNDDQYIDILDFGTFVSQYGVNYGTGNTTCATPYPHADISGDGLVAAADYSFIQINFLKFHEANCCGAALRLPGDNGPVTRISVKELIRRGMRDLTVADLNGDGWLDTTDAQLFTSTGGTGGGGTR